MSIDYGQLRKSVLEGLGSIELCSRQREAEYISAFMAEAKDKVIYNKFNLVVLGEFKRGKTTFLNALLGAEILPVAVVPLTSIVTTIQYGEKIRCTVVFLNGDREEIAISRIADYATEEGNPRNEKEVKLVQLEYPSACLQEGLFLIDTPGVGSIYQNNTDETYSYLPKVDAAIFLISADQPLSLAECGFLKKVKQYSAKTFFILNKIDYLDKKDRPKALAFTKKALEDEAGFENIKIIPLSAKMALEGRIKNNEKMLKESNLPGFTELLEQFLNTEKGITALAAAISKGISAADALLTGIELEMKALMIPLDDLYAKISFFNRMADSLSQDQQDNKYIYQGEMQKVYSELEREITAFQEAYTGKITNGVEELYREKKGLSSNQLLNFLRSFIESEVKAAFENWKPELEEKIKDAFQKVVSRFTKKTNKAIEELLRQSAEIFEISIEGFTRIEAVTEESRLYFIYGEDQPLLFPDSLKISAFFLPKFISSPMVLKEMKKKVERELDRNCGRVRTDYNDRIYKSAKMFQKSFEEKFAQAIESTKTVLNRAVNKRQRSKSEIEEAISKLIYQKNLLIDNKEKMNGYLCDLRH